MLIKIGDFRYNWRNIESYHPDGDLRIVIRTATEIRGFKFKDNISRNNALASLDEAISNNCSCEIKVN